MATSRLTTALASGELRLPDTGRILLIGPDADADLSALPQARCHVVQTFKPDHDALAARGFDCATAPDGRYAAAIVFLPRMRELAQARVAQAAALTDELLVVDGQKTDGVEPMVKQIRAVTPLLGQIAKAHGRAVWCAPDAGFAAWASPAPGRNADGHVTAPGVFSADGIDPASARLAEALPARLGSAVADLGAGWGFLSLNILTREDVSTLHVVEADHAALDCARANVTDPRARFHWADATDWVFPERLDAVVMNPPFHVSRKADPKIGQAFIAAAAGMLKPSGHLWLVANRHLPYEAALSDHFTQVEEHGSDPKFKILHAQRPTRTRR